MRKGTEHSKSFKKYRFEKKIEKFVWKSEKLNKILKIKKAQENVYSSEK